MKKNIKYGVLFLMLLLVSVLSMPTANISAEPQVTIIESEDTFATDTEYDVNVISEDWVIIVINCPGVFGFC